jgi:hypothetical protein
MTTAKLDLYKEFKQDYVAPKKPVLIRVSTAKYLAITGRGEPGGAMFQEHVGALYGAAFTLKMEKKAAGRDYKVCHLEGLWWGDNNEPVFPSAPPSSWNWKLLIRVPDFVTATDLDKAISRLKEKGKRDPASEITLETISEGLIVQMLHVGPYAEEQKTIAEMLKLAQSNGKSFCGMHHEIYLSDPRRVAPERLRTILRMPVQDTCV